MRAELERPSKVVRAEFRDGSELKGQLFPDAGRGGLFVPGVTNLALGEQVYAWIQLRQPDVQLYLLADVAWIRHQQQPRLPAGTCLAFLRGQEERVGFLTQYAGSVSPPVQHRRRNRTPLLQPWACNLRTADGEELFPALVSDIGRGGVLAVSRGLSVRVGQGVLLTIPAVSGITHHLDVAWQHDQGAILKLGLCRPVGDEGEEAEWERLAAAASEKIRAKLWNI